MKRIYKTGSKWAFWRWTEFAGDYISRLFLALTPWFSVFIHKIHKPDPHPYLHDHPTDFLSLILRGGYTEERGDGKTYTRNWFNFVRATPNVRHRIISVEPNTTTLCFSGPRKRIWGFHTPRGWVDWKTHNNG